MNAYEPETHAGATSPIYAAGDSDPDFFFPAPGESKTPGLRIGLAGWLPAARSWLASR